MPFILFQMTYVFASNWFRFGLAHSQYEIIIPIIIWIYNFVTYILRPAYFQVHINDPIHSIIFQSTSYYHPISVRSKWASARDVEDPLEDSADLINCQNFKNLNIYEVLLRSILDDYWLMKPMIRVVWKKWNHERGSCWERTRISPDFIICQTFKISNIRLF